MTDREKLLAIKENIASAICSKALSQMDFSTEELSIFGNLRNIPISEIKESLNKVVKLLNLYGRNPKRAAELAEDSYLDIKNVNMLLLVIASIPESFGVASVWELTECQAKEIISEILELRSKLEGR